MLLLVESALVSDLIYVSPVKVIELDLSKLIVTSPWFLLLIAPVYLELFFIFNERVEIESTTISPSASWFVRFRVTFPQVCSTEY